MVFERFLRGFWSLRFKLAGNHKDTRTGIPEANKSQPKSHPKSIQKPSKSQKSMKKHRKILRKNVKIPVFEQVFYRKNTERNRTWSVSSGIALGFFHEVSNSLRISNIRSAHLFTSSTQGRRTVVITAPSYL